MSQELKSAYPAAKGTKIIEMIEERESFLAIDHFEVEEDRFNTEFGDVSRILGNDETKRKLEMVAPMGMHLTDAIDSQGNWLPASLLINNKTALEVYKNHGKNQKPPVEKASHLKLPHHGNYQEEGIVNFSLAKINLDEIVSRDQQDFIEKNRTALKNAR